MENSNLISLLKTFSKTEMKEFDKFLRSPYFTEGKNIRHRILYDYFQNLKNFYPDFSDSQFTKEHLYSKLYPDTKYNDGIMRKLNSDLTGLAEKYLVQIEMEKNEVDYRKYLLAQLSARKSEKVYMKKFNDMLRYLDSLDKDETYFYETYNVWKNYWNSYLSNRNIYKISESIKTENNYFIFVILGALGIYLWAISFFRVVNMKNEMYLFDEIMEHVKNNYDRYKEIPQILFKYNLILLFTEKDESYFRELRNLKKKYFASLSAFDKYNTFVMMTNYCHDMILNGRFDYRKERFDLDKEMLSQKLFTALGGLHVFVFLAIAKNANRLGEYKWTEKMSSDYAGIILPSDKDFALNYVKADIAYSKKNYGKALEHLSRFKIEHSNEKQFTRNLMIQIYYEMNENLAALSLIDSSRHFLHSDKYLSPSTKEHSLKFINITEQLIKARDKMEQDVIFHLRKDIASTLNIQNKDWLLEKIEELKHK